MHNETFEVTDEYEEERLDKFLAAIYPEQSRSFFQKLIKDGLVSVNDVPQSKANYRMHIEDMVSVTIPDAVKTTILPEAIPLDILYEDDAVMSGTWMYNHIFGFINDNYIIIFIQDV